MGLARLPVQAEPGQLPGRAEPARVPVRAEPGQLLGRTGPARLRHPVQAEPAPPPGRAELAQPRGRAGRAQLPSRATHPGRAAPPTATARPVPPVTPARTATRGVTPASRPILQRDLARARTARAVRLPSPATAPAAPPGTRAQTRAPSARPAANPQRAGPSANDRKKAHHLRRPLRTMPRIAPRRAAVNTPPGPRQPFSCEFRAPWTSRNNTIMKRPRTFPVKTGTKSAPRSHSNVPTPKTPGNTLASKPPGQRARAMGRQPPGNQSNVRAPRDSRDRASAATQERAAWRVGPWQVNPQAPLPSRLSQSFSSGA